MKCKTDPRLKPCPFCGRMADVTVMSRTRRELYLGTYHTQWYVMCDDAFDGCGAESGYKQTEAEAIDAWNRRKEEGE